jgi:hypothetical protein
VTHLSLDQLTRLRDPEAEPGLASAREHLAGCDQCQAEARALEQRVARLRALPTLRPGRDHWAQIRSRVAADRRRRRFKVAGLVSFAAAACLVLAIALRPAPHRQAATATALNQVMAQSSGLEEALRSYNPDARVTDGVTAGVAGELEDRIAVVDQQLQMAQLLDAAQRDARLLQLWRERVGLLDALVDVHLTRASNVGM